MDTYNRDGFLENIPKEIQGKESLERTHFNSYGCKGENVRNNGREIVTMMRTPRMSGNRLLWRTGT